MAAVDELEAAVSAWTTARTVAAASGALAAAGIPFGPVAQVADAVASPQIAAREMLVEIEHPSLGALLVTGLPVKLSATPGAVRKAPPMVGEDNDRIYREVLGLDASARSPSSEPPARSDRRNGTTDGPAAPQPRALAPEPAGGPRLRVLPDVLGLAVLVEAARARAPGRVRTA